MFWGIVFKLYCLIFLITFDIAIYVHVAKYDLSTSWLSSICVPVGDDCWFVSCLLFPCLICVVRCYMIEFLFLYLLFCCRRLICFSLVLTQFERCTSRMDVTRVGDHICDAWTVFNDCFVFKQPRVMDASMSFSSLMFNCDIVLLMILFWIICPLLNRSWCCICFMRWISPWWSCRAHLVSSWKLLVQTYLLTRILVLNCVEFNKLALLVT